jgi:hypothetical protein
LSYISASTEGSLPENTATWQASKSRIVVHADEKLTAFLEREASIRARRELA